MSKKKLTSPNFLFEVSWEVCNKVGGIHTVIATKIASIAKQMQGMHFVIGPDLGQGDDANSEFREDPTLLSEWRRLAAGDGLKIRIGRWNVDPRPVAILVDFSPFFAQKDAIFSELWDEYQLDSLTGEWDYIEPAMFGHAAGKVIENYIKNNCTSRDKIVAQFHEWMTGSGLLYLRSNVEQVACAFTTHATALGRCIAGNNLPLYDDMESYNADEVAQRFNIRAKQSLEKCAALYADAFTTVSDITARECKHFFDKPVDLVTPNGFQDFITDTKKFAKMRKDGRKALIDVAEGILAQPISKDALLIGTSGRYEFKNKGIDVFINTLAQLNNNKKLKREIVAFILVPAGHTGPIPQLLENLEKKVKGATPLPNPYLSHGLQDEWNDPSLSNIRRCQLYNKKEDKVKVFFVPSYLNGDDGVFNVPYYNLLAGLDVSLFPSYYEPWGYTPLESVAFKVPTITTTLAGFGLWVQDHFKTTHPGVTVIKRTDTNDEEVVAAMAKDIMRHAEMSADDSKKAKESAYEVSKIALWDNLNQYYMQVYSDALDIVSKRYSPNSNKLKMKYVSETKNSSTPVWHDIIVHRKVPTRFKSLEELAHNLWWSWNQDAIDLFKSMDSKAWGSSKKNPITLLDLIPLDRFKELEKDEKFLAQLDSVYAKYKEYMSLKGKQKGPKVAYFCMEYGLHSSLKIYSGGLGVLAGDYLKEASDKGVNMTGVGFLYRYGYFTQHLSGSGAQENIYEPQLFDKMPVDPVRDKDGNWVTVEVDFPGRKVFAHVWKVTVGRVDLFLLDTDFEDNLPEDRSISHQLYGGDWENRIKQEVLLGIGGIRILEKLGITADVYHCNEGHAAFIGFERIHHLMRDNGLNFDEAMEVVRSSSLFTTHTPVPAGHDAFDEGLFHKYFHFTPERFGVSWERIIGLGRVNASDPNEKFSMSNLALRMSQETNGVSWLHGEVSRQMFQNIYPGYLAEEVPIGYVTNGVHYPTWAAPEWKELCLKLTGNDIVSLKYDKQAFRGIQNVDPKEIWGVRNILRAKLIKYIKWSILSSNLQYYTPRELVEIAEKLDPNKLTIGFARRFATYKRADLLFRNLDTLNEIINNPDRPVQFIFAGKAHPADKAGQDLIKRIVEVSKYPQFLGKIIFIENYDMEIASKMVQGVDIWLNTPTRPMEASGTSGEKAVMNGVMHFSVLDGWWVEGYKEGAGWMLPLEQTYENNDFQNELDAEIVYATIENDIAPQFYTRDKNGVPTQWVHTIKNSLELVAPEFTMNRMMIDYEERFYNKLEKRHKAIVKKDFAMAKEIVAWKNKVKQEWDKIEIITALSFDIKAQAVALGDEYAMEVTISCANLSPSDIGVEVLLLRKEHKGHKLVDVLEKVSMKYVSQEDGVAKYQLKYVPEVTGTYTTAIRVYPTSKLLAHQTELCLTKWV